MVIRAASNLDDPVAQDLSSIVGMLLTASQDLHVQHLLSNKHSEHVVLKDIYELCADLADSIAEEVGGSDTPLIQSLLNTSSITNAASPLDYVTRLLGELTMRLSRLPTDLSVHNTVTDAISQLTQKRYLLRLTTDS